jgi:nicotinamide mononucleotide transporter
MMTELLDKTLGMLIYLFTSLEGWSFNFSLIYVILSIRKNKYSWVFAIISSILYGIICLDYKMYPTAGLQLFFVLSSIYGFIQWNKYSNKKVATKIEDKNKSEKTPWDYTQLSKNAWVLFSSLTVLLAGLISITLLLFTKSTNHLSLYVESFATAGSLVAQYLLARKCIHNWHFWFVVNIAYVFVNMYQSLYFMAILYAIFMVLSIQGYVSWKKKDKQELAKTESNTSDSNINIHSNKSSIQHNEELIQIKQMV